MASATAFADILDEMVGGFAGASTAQDPPFQARYIPPNPFLFTEPKRPFRPSPYRDVRGSRAAANQAASAGRHDRPRPARPARPLTSRQRQAFDAFNGLGGELTPDFTAAELRSAYRRLALTYHPDRHGDRSEFEQARLTRVLADLNAHHRELMAALRTAA